MELEAEKFKTAQELAALSTQVAEAGAALTKLKSENEEFYKEREAETNDRVHAVILASRELLIEATKHHDTFKRYISEIGEIKQEFADMVASLSTLRTETQEYKTSVGVHCEEGLADLTQRGKEIETHRKRIEEDLSFIKTQREILRSEKIKIMDEWGTLQRAKKELTGKK